MLGTVWAQARNILPTQEAAQQRIAQIEQRANSPSDCGVAASDDDADFFIPRRANPGPPAPQEDSNTSAEIDERITPRFALICTDEQAALMRLCVQATSVRGTEIQHTNASSSHEGVGGNILARNSSDTDNPAAPIDAPPFIG